MKKLFLVISFLITPFVAQAEVGAGLDFCNDISELAGNVMEARQNGVSASALIESAEKNFKDVPDYLSLVTGMVETAFSDTRYDTEKDKQIAIEELSSSFFLGCYITLKSL